MSVPFMKKLSHAFEKAINGSRLYGRVHTSREKVTFYGRDLAMSILYDVYPAQERVATIETSKWLEATRQKDGAFKLIECQREGSAKTLHRYMGICSEEHLVQMARGIEGGWRREGFRPDAVQPFAGRLIEDHKFVPPAPTSTGASPRM